MIQGEFQPVGNFAKIDRHRARRTGFPEVIFGQGKTPEQIEQIFKTMQQDHPVVMATRILPEVYAQLVDRLWGLEIGRAHV